MRIIYSTYPDRKSLERILKELVGKGIVKCANYWKIKSQYIWKKKLQKTEEYACILKVSEENFDVAVKELRKLHPYEVPAIISFDCDFVNEEFLSWIREREEMI